MPFTIKPLKLIIVSIKEHIKHPFSYRKRLFELSEPNIIYGLTDHPLDIYGDPLLSVHDAIKKIFSKKAIVIRELNFKEREGNSFYFKCNAYNIFLFRPIPKEMEDFVPLPKLGRKPKEITLKISFLTPSNYRVLCVLGKTIPEHKTEMVIKDVTESNFKVEFRDENQIISLKTSELSLAIDKTDFKIEVFDINNHLITESSGRSKNDFASALDSFPLGFIKIKKNKKMYGTETFVLFPGEAIFGLGEHYSTLNKRGQTVHLWNFEGCGNSSNRAYKNIPFFLSTRGYGVYVNESKPITFWVGSRELCKNMFAVEGDLIDYYFFYGPDFKKILYNYTELTGKAPVPPKWSFGAWMSRISYHTQEEVLEVAARLRKDKYPFDVLHIDTDWFEKDWFCDWKFDKKKFPDPKEMCAKLKGMGFKLSLWQTPCIMDGVKEYKEAKKLKIAAKNQGPFVFLFNPSVAIDFSNPEAVVWYQNKLRNLFEIGASVIKTDFGEQVQLHQKFLKCNGREMHNLFPLLYQKAAFEVTKEFFGKGIIWARSAYAGSQRFPVHWSGDSSSQFEEMLNVLRGGLSLGLSGFTYWSQDVGGFIFSPSDKLYIRWTQFSIFNSHIRYHGNPPRHREPWNYNEDVQNITRDFLNLRYQLIPYIYTEAHYCSENGLPMLAPLVLEFQDDRNTFNIEDEFMFGRSLLIAPILTKEDERVVYLPKGSWFDFWTLEKHEGPCWLKVQSSLDKIPVFIREGAIVPLGPVMQYVDERKLDEIIIVIIPTKELKINSYRIVDDTEIIEVKPTISDRVLIITTSIPLKNISVEIPGACEIKEIKINNQLLPIKQESNKRIASMRLNS